ncbi:hypothetical protein EC973_006780 [Apophysomyces ossiformis]|uniref:VPS9 domain-containing protein n=1 Tax=Apophysomyces ossiformis TaxID=679940 RepID=A0A8H7ERF3_9FUNG|nr:hypothetical protein EC973_006780 [Apophysomyces ossiformis]
MNPVQKQPMDDKSKSASPDPDELVDEYDEKLALQEEESSNDHIDEKEALRKEHQAELDVLLSKPHADEADGQSADTPQQEHDPSTRHDVEFQQIFNQFENKPEDDKVAEQASETSDQRQASLTDIQKASDHAKGREQQEIPFDFNKFLEQMKRRSAIPITRYFKRSEFPPAISSTSLDSQRASDYHTRLSKFQFIYGKMRENEVWRDVSDREFENAKEGMEKLVMNRLYPVTFSPATTDDKERDEILQQKISIFRWVREEHLDIPVTEHNESFMTFAESGLIKHVEGDTGGADKFLPILIYVVLRANPAHLVSNVQNPEHLQSESGYYLTNLMGAITFIETMEAKSLSITKEEFELNIGRTMDELDHERPTVSQDKQKINYDNAVHPSRSPRATTQQPLIDPIKAAALLEKGTTFAQKTMQKPLNFVGKIIQGLGEGSSRPDSPEYDEEGRYRERQPVYYSQQQQPPWNGQETSAQYEARIHGYAPGSPYYPDPTNIPSLPPRPMVHPPTTPEALAQQEARRSFDESLKIITNMFPNVEPDVCFLILQENDGRLPQTVDILLEISDPEADRSSDPIPKQLVESTTATEQQQQQQQHDSNANSTEQGKKQEEELIKL